MCVLSSIYIYVPVCRFSAVCCLISNCSLCYFLITRLVFLIFFMFVFLFCVFCVFCIESPFVYSCYFPIPAKVYRQLPLGRNPITVNKYHIISYHCTGLHVHYLNNTHMNNYVLNYAQGKKAEELRKRYDFSTMVNLLIRDINP